MPCGVIRSLARLTCRADGLLHCRFWGRNLVLMGRNFADHVQRRHRKVMVDSSKTIIMLMFIIVNALLFAHVLTSERIPQAITDLMIGAGFTGSPS
jgi:C4-dicarboxylate transporter DctM subunit